jgi:hypothetical protein
VFNSDNVDVFNNVAYMNNQNPALAQQGPPFSPPFFFCELSLNDFKGELTAQSSNNVRFFNNIAYTHASGNGNSNAGSTYVIINIKKNILITNNIYILQIRANSLKECHIQQQPLLQLRHTRHRPH